MAETEEDVGPNVRQYWWAEAWAGARPRFIVVAKELILSLELLLVLAILYLFSRLLILVGVPAESVQRLDRVDFWLIYAVFFTFGLFFLVELLMGMYVSIVSSKRAETEANQ